MDELVGRKGLRIYGEMGTDDAVKAALAMKKHAVLSTGWDVEPASDDPLDKEIAEFVKWNFIKMQGSLDSNLQEIMSALSFGFSLSELLWTKLDQQTPYPGKIGLAAIKARSPIGFTFITDMHSNLLPDGIEQFGRRLPLEKFVHFAYQADFQNAYGVSDLRAAYRPYWLKLNTWTWFGQFLDRYSVPLAEGIVPSHAGVPDNTVVNLRAALMNLQAATTFVHGDDVTLKFPTSGISAQGSAIFERAISLCDLAIARALLLPNLLGLSAQGTTGSFSQARKHFDMYILLVEKLQRDLSEVVMGEQVIRRLVDLNYTVQTYPQFLFLPFTESDKGTLLELWIQAVQAGAVQSSKEDETHIRRVVEFPEVSEAGLNVEQPEEEVGGPEASGIDAMIEEVLREQVNA